MPIDIEILKIYYNYYVRDEILKLFISYTDKKNKYPIQIIDVRFQVDHFNPEKIHIYQE